jgi:thiamine pyrophosphate-dependent acetolactate synthase large subunit-like protein
VFDYLDKVQPSRGQAKLFGDNTWERQAADMEALKTFAEKSNIPVFTATQGNKSMQNGGTQTRQNIQGSGQKSQKAQLVIILSRDIVGDGGLYDSDNVLLAEAGEYSPIVNVRVDKQNRGRTGGFKQYLAGKYFTVRDIERRPLES